MPNILCLKPQSDCSDPSLPQTNYSSEAPDNRAFFGRAYNPGLFPPLGSPWQSTGCIGTCTSTISQADANACAARQVITCLSGEWPVYEDNPNDDPEQPPVLTRDRPTFLNEEQSCNFTCADGNVFTYTVPAGTVLAFSLAAANASAASIACNRAIDLRICVGELSPAGACLGAAYSGTVEISAPVRPGGFAVTALDVPPGISMSFSGTTISFTGFPSAAGEYPVMIQVEDADGNFMSKTVTFYVVGILPDTLPDAQLGIAYSQTLTTVGPVLGTVVWAIVGTLPDGLTLNASTGEISGTPTTAQTSSFTATMTDER